MEFIKELEEAKLTRTRMPIERLSYADICERVYLSLLIIELVRKYKPFDTQIMKYANSTRSYSKFLYYRSGHTDLHNFIYYINGDDTVLNRLNNPESAIKEKANRSFPLMAVNRYLTQIANNNSPSNIYNLFTSIEQGLKIKNSEYKNIRKVITNRNTSSANDITKAANKLLRYSKLVLKSTDIIVYIESLLSKNTFNLQPPSNTLVNDKQPLIDGEDLYYIAEIVGYSNVLMAMKFLELMEKGETIPSTVQRGFLPAIQLLIDIIKGGPAYVNTLKTLQRQAKRTQK